MKLKLTDLIRAQHKHPFPYLCLLTLTLASAVPSFAATQTVTNTNDSGAGSLRQAIANASSGDTITFNLPNPSTITLTSGHLEINKNLTITGPGQTQLAIDGNKRFTVFFIDQQSTVSMSGLTIQHGQGDLLADQTQCLGSNCAYGGGIENEGAALTLTAVTVSGNATTTDGGGIDHVGFALGGNPGSLTINNSTISGNSAGGIKAGGEGGGIFAFGPTTITSSTISGNSAVDYSEGGGVSSAIMLTIASSTISGNSAQVGAGVAIDEGGVTIINSTISGNTAAGVAGGLFFESFDSPTNLVNDTIAGNSAPSGDGGGLYFGGGSIPGKFSSKSTLLADNSGGNCGFYDGRVGFVSNGYNLSDDSSCGNGLTQSTDKNGTPAQLAGGLANNGGPTQTIALSKGSPEVDAIPAASCTDASGNKVTTDERGIARPQGQGCDIGAYELVQTVPFSTFRTFLAIDDGKHPGFVLTSSFTLGSGTIGLTPTTEAMTLQIGNYTLSLPAGSFRQLWNASNAPYAYSGTVNGTSVVLGLTLIGNNTYAFDAAGSPGSFSGIKNPVPITLTFGNDSGSASTTAAITQQ